MELVLIAWGASCAIGTAAVVRLGRALAANRREVAANQRRIAALERSVDQAHTAEQVLARARRSGRHLRGLVVIPAVWLARRALQPQVAAAVTALAITGGGAAAIIDPPREPRTYTEPAGARDHTRLAVQPPAEPVAAAQPAEATPLEDSRIIREDPPAPTLTTPTTAAPAPPSEPAEPLALTTTTTLPPELIELGDTSDDDCAVDLGGLGLGVGLLCA